jgi:hypothetical protein
MTYPPRTLLGVLLAGLGASACGGNVVVDLAATKGGTGGAAGTTSSSNIAASSTSTGGPVECSGTYGHLDTDIDAATLCNPTLDKIQCSGAVMLTDECGCPRIANETLPQAVAAAQGTFMLCVMEGCCGPGAHPNTPPSCLPCLVATMGFCDPMTNHCAAQ